MICFNRFLRSGRCRWKNCACQPPSISGVRGGDRRKPVFQSGQVDVVMAMFFFLIVLIAAQFQFKIHAYMAAGAYVEDALAASGLASALIDMEEYGRNHNIRIADTQNAFQIYRDALYYNLALDEEGHSAKTELLTGEIRLEEYIVYNVLGQEIQCAAYDGQGNCLWRESASLGSVRTPEGIAVEHTTVYSRVRFRVMGILGQVIEAVKEKSIDIVRDESEG